MGEANRWLWGVIGAGVLAVAACYEEPPLTPKDQWVLTSGDAGCPAHHPGDGTACELATPTDYRWCYYRDPENDELREECNCSIPYGMGGAGGGAEASWGCEAPMYE